MTETGAPMVIQTRPRETPQEYALRSYCTFFDYITNAKTEFTSDFKSDTCTWYEENDASGRGQNFEHMYNCLARYHMRYGVVDTGFVYGTILRSIFTLCDLAKQHSNPVGLPKYLVFMLLAFFQTKSEEKDAVWDARIKQVVSMCRNQVEAMCDTICARLANQNYHMFPGNHALFVADVGMVPMTVHGLHNVIFSVRKVFSEDKNIVSYCDAIMKHKF